MRGIESGRAQRAAAFCGSLLLVSTALGCARSTVTATHGEAKDAGKAKPRVKVRTVRIEMFKTAERALEQTADGSFKYGALTDIGGVDVCVAQRRDAFASFQPFVPLVSPICVKSVAGESVQLEGVPVSSDLIITFAKDGYQTEVLTFRTDENDVGAPPWGIAVALLADGAVAPWVEPEPQPAAGDGVVAIWASVSWSGVGVPPATPAINADASYVSAEGVSVEIEREDSSPVRAPLVTLRERPLWVSLPAGLYRFRFSHPKMNMGPVGAGAQYYVVGLPTDAVDTVEVPVVARDWISAVAFGSCAAPIWGQQVQDLATCRLGPIDAGIP